MSLELNDEQVEDLRLVLTGGPGCGGAAAVLAALLPPETPPSIVTDEMVEAVLVARWGDDAPIFHLVCRGYLEAAVECGWTPPGESGDESLSETESGAPLTPADNERTAMIRSLIEKTDRLAVAEGLLRRLDFGVPYVLPDGGPRFWSVGEITVTVTADEAEYLRSLTGEGDSDE